MVAGAVLLGTATSVLAATEATVTVGSTVESWYRTTPTCLLPSGCVDATGVPSPYAAETVHVGVLTGAPESRTYLVLDLTALPAGARPTGGTLVLPVATGGTDGTTSPETATVQACAVSEPVVTSDGSFAPPLATDCEAASAPATFVPARGSDPASFTVPLAGLARAWAAGSIDGALALLPAADTASSATWHTAFSARGRAGEVSGPIRAALTYTSAPAPVQESGVTASDGAPPPGAFAPTAPALETFNGGSGVAAPPLPGAGPAALPEVAAPPTVAGPPAAAPPERPLQAFVSAETVREVFRYPVVFLLPLLLVLAVGWLGRALTRDLTVLPPVPSARA